MSKSPSRRRRTARPLGVLLAGTVAAAALVVLPEPAYAVSNSFQFSHNRDQHASFGANGVVMIDGTLTYQDHCVGLDNKPKGVDDFVWAASSIYVVAHDTVWMGSNLKDAGGGDPNVIVASGTSFSGETIAVTTPSGSLGDGAYDIVFDTCQDGIVDREDTIFSDAFTVDVPDGNVPPVDPSLRLMKDKAREEYATWLKMHMGLTALFKVEDAKSLAECILAPSQECLEAILVSIFGPKDPYARNVDKIQDLALNLVANKAANYGAIWKDPADPDYKVLPRPVAAQELPPAGGGAGSGALAEMAEPLQREAALTEALLHALERYQGAQAAGDAEWALVQARAVRDLSSALEAGQADSGLPQLRSVVAANLDAIDADARAGAQFANRVRTSGLTPAERRALANDGLIEAQVRGIESAFVARGNVSVPDKTTLLADIDAALAADRGMRDALTDSAAGWAGHVEALEQQVEAAHPTAEAGGPYVAGADGTVSLDASRSSAAPGESRITEVGWDLDGDGEYDDATGALAEATVDSSRTVSVKVTDDAGRSGVDFGHVDVSGGDRAPVVSGASPDRAVRVVVGDTEEFAVQASDPDGTPVSFRWTFGDGVVAGATGATYTYTPGVADVGARILRVEATSGRRTTVHTWAVTTQRPDGDGDGWTATSDCDDARADVHPGALERVGNGLDEDCDTDTPDAPPGGVAGSVTGWGSSVGVGLPPRNPLDLPYYAPVPVPNLGSSVRALESTDRSGYAVLTDGTVRSWGQNFHGRLGDGTLDVRYAPVTVRNVQGETGSALPGVAQLAADSDTALAVLSTGKVAGWGSNVNRQLGDGSTVSERPVPVWVAAEEGGTLGGVAQVELGENSAYAVMRDGTVRTWGQVRCDDSALDTVSTVAARNPRFGSGVVQIASGDGGGALVRKADGSVQSCGGYEGMLGRPWTNADKNSVRPVPNLGAHVIDVAMGSSTALALKDDGSVWTWGKNVNHELDVLGKPAGGVQDLPAQVTLPAGAPVTDVETDYSGTAFALRADGSVLVWGSNPYGAAGIGTTQAFVPGIAVLDLGGARAIGVSGSGWNGLALVRPADDPAWERPASWVSASVADTEVDEGTGGSAPLTLSAPAPDGLQVTYRVADGSVRTSTVPAGATTAQLPVSVPDDGLDEDDETLPLQVVGITHGVRVAGGSAAVTVHDDDAAPALSVASVDLDEGNTSLVDVPVRVTLSAPSGRDVEVLWHTEDGTATAPGDFGAAEGHLLVPAGETTATAHLAVIGDAEPEGTEELAVVLTDPVHAGLGAARAAVTVRDDDAVRVSVASPHVTEGDTGTEPATFTVTADAVPEGETVTLPWSVKPVTADLGDDVVDATGTVTFDSTHPTREVVVQVVGDRRAEALATELFGLRLGTAEATGDRAVVVAEVPPAEVADNDKGPVVVAGPAVQGAEGSALALHGQSDAAQVTWTVDSDRCVVAAPHALDTAVTCSDEVDALLSLTGDDGVNPAVTDQTTLTVSNAAPKLAVTSPVAESHVTAGVPVRLTTTVTDPGVDDAAQCTVDWGDGTGGTACADIHTYASAGSRTLVVDVADGDGGTDTVSVALTVDPAGSGEPTAWPWGGFYQPVDNLPVVNVVNAGSTVPMKFSVGGYRGTDLFAAGFPASSAQSCLAGAPSDVLEQVSSPGASGLTYDAGSDRYQLNWKTQKSWAGSCRTLVLKLRDGSTHTAQFRFK